jgi:hypothetical protein
MRRAMGAVAALALIAAGAGTARSQGTPAVLQGTFAMRGKVTRAVGVYGEHVGQRVRRTWTFAPQCNTGDCPTVLLARQRSGRRILDSLTLTRRASGLYVGRGRFWVALRCEGRTVAHGGLAAETITVRITATATVGATEVATAISASYRNPWRKNLTRCPGGIGHDAARYSGRLVSPPS